MEQRKRRCLDVNSCTGNQLVCNQGSKNIGWGRTVTLLIVLLIVLASNGYSLRKNETRHPYAVYKISKEIKDSRVKPPSQGLAGWLSGQQLELSPGSLLPCDGRGDLAPTSCPLSSTLSPQHNPSPTK